MSLLYSLYLKINKKENADAKLLDALLLDSSVADFQILALVSGMIFHEIKTANENSFFESSRQNNPEVKKYTDALLGIKNGEKIGKIPTSEYELLYDAYWGVEIGKTKIAALLSDVCLETFNKNFLSVFLTVIKHVGLKDADLRLLTELMASSGETYDYRDNKDLEYRKIIRRYPTGALSEKIALIMPSLLMAFSGDFPICSPFLVARSLSYTGGTWDKLRSIDGFRFPSQGDDTIEILKECKVSMTVTENAFNPADRVLYQFRSITNTVESSDLIVSSIASKQMANPADSLLLDVRYGEGAFLQERSDADKLGYKISTLLNNAGIKTDSIKTEAKQPTGSCIGNYWEVLEAIAIMSNSNKLFGFNFDDRALREQCDLVIKMTIEVLKLQFPHLDKERLRDSAFAHFQKGIVLNCFFKLLAAHHANGNIITNIKENRNWIPTPPIENKVIASATGVLTKVNQKEIGSFVNFELGGGRNQFTGVTNYFSGMILTKRLNDNVRKGEVLAKVMHTSHLEKEQLYDKIYFGIEAI
jgi:thymidine phosphorylase